MNTRVALLLAAAAVCAIARPGPSVSPALAQHELDVNERKLSAYQLTSPNLINHFFRGHVINQYQPLEPIVHPSLSESNWLDEEIDRINRMSDDKENKGFNTAPSEWIVNDPFIRRIFSGTVIRHHQDRMSETSSTGTHKHVDPMSSTIMDSTVPDIAKPPLETYNRQPLEELRIEQREDDKQFFAYTPLEKGYYESSGDADSESSSPEQSMLNDGLQDGESPRVEALLKQPRQTRQNPNWSKTKSLVAGDLDKLRARLAYKDGYSLPVSLLPNNLRWLDDDSVESSHEEGKTKSQDVHKLETTDSYSPSFGAAFLAVFAAIAAMAVGVVALFWYTLSKKAKAAADVDYPAYGVTGPNVDTSGDRKLAHSAHMYHYQHQKQQIIAMERSCLEQGSGSVSDPESEEENEEGDYTVYECPGFATTGDMEVKNPMFTDEPTPVTPGKCEVVKPQPKE